MKARIRLTGRADVKIRNKVPVFRNWRLVWEIREGTPQHYDLAKEETFQLGKFDTHHGVDLGPVEIAVDIENDPKNQDRLLVTLVATALDGAAPLAGISFDVADLLKIDPLRAVFVWTPSASARGVDAKLKAELFLIP